MRKHCLFFLFGVILSFNCLKAEAHPHVFIDTDITICFDDKGVGSLKVAFTFDEMFSADFISQFDIDKNNILDKQEIQIIKEKAFSNLINYNYFIHVISNKGKLKFTEVYDFKAQIKNNVVVYSFTIKPNTEIGNENKIIKIAPYDHSYYIDVALNDKTLSFENANDYSYSYKIIEDKNQAYYYDQIYPECIVLTIKHKQKAS